MFVNLYQKVESLTNRAVTLNTISRGVFRYSVKIAEVYPFLKELKPNDLDLFKRRATYTIEDNGKDKRSVVIPLENPIDINGKTINSLRLKGVFPQVLKNGVINRYTNGRGFSPRTLKVIGRDLIQSRTDKTASDYNPQGSMEIQRLSEEVEGAIIIGPARTDLLLGFGVFEDLHFNNNPIGFAIYGMERKQDIRVFSYLWEHIENNGSLPQEANKLAEHTGKLQAEVHQECKLLLGTPHLGNYGVFSEREARILDLASSKLLDYPAENRLALLYNNISRTINDYLKEITYKQIHDGEAEEEITALTSLLPFFLWGYFNGDKSLSLIRRLEEFVNGDYQPWELTQTFGSLPYFGNGFRSGGTFTLVEPIVELYALPAESIVNLEDFITRNDLFADFYNALKEVSESI